ncbi:MAG: DNA-processing protein DprA [Pseudoflavonifractor sp.]
MATLKYWLWLTGRRGLRGGDAFRVLEQFGTPEAAYFADPAEYEESGLNPRACAALQEKNLDEADRILADCDRLGIRVLTIQDAEYPERLANIYDPPCVLYVKGKVFAFDEEVAIGVVGSREPSEYGKRMAGKLGGELARSGALVVSGIAQGLDTAALRGALAAGGPAVSVLGGGIDVIYPRENTYLYQDIAAVGALISEYPPGTENEGWHFPVRNRILSGLSVGVVAVEAAARSGTLITARLALDQSREVFAFPGPADAPMSRGTNLLINRGEAKLVTCGWDLLCEYVDRFPGKLTRPKGLVEEPPEPMQDTKKAKPEPEPAEKPVDKAEKRAYITLQACQAEFTDDERDILLALAKGPLRSDDLVEAVQIPARRVLSALTMLQVRGHVKELSGKRFESNVELETE